MAPSRDIISRRKGSCILLRQKPNVLLVMADRSTTDHRLITDRCSPPLDAIDGRACMAALSPEQPDQGDCRHAQALRREHPPQAREAGSRAGSLAFSRA